MKKLQKIHVELNNHGVVVLEDLQTKEETIITMPADRFAKFLRKFRDLVGQQVEVANGWIFPASNTRI
jgi:hypothetical protein